MRPRKQAGRRIPPGQVTVTVGAREAIWDTREAYRLHVELGLRAQYEPNGWRVLSRPEDVGAAAAAATRMGWNVRIRGAALPAATTPDAEAGLW